MMPTPSMPITVNWAKYNIGHFLAFQSNDAERIVMAAHELIEGGILHLPVIYLNAVLVEFFRQMKEWQTTVMPTSDESAAFWNDALRGIKGIDEE